MKKLWQDFITFIMTGNLIMLAVAFILGGATKSVIDSFVANIINPIIGIFIGEPKFDSVIEIGDGRIEIGLFITAVINLLVIGLVLFAIVKAYERFQKEQGPDEPSDEVKLLTEIRDSLAAR
jgi:large conductance mechanosensitive channel